METTKKRRSVDKASRPEKKNQHRSMDELAKSKTERLMKLLEGVELPPSPGGE
jgi:hypothetical protein